MQNTSEKNYGDPTISVCIATCNGERFIGAQLSSIVAQSVPPAEIILVDDGSVDATVEIAEKILRTFSGEVRIEVNKKRQGVNKTFRQAISLSTQQIIVFSDQDDIWYSQRLKNIQKKFSAERNDLLLTNANIEEDGRLSDRTLFGRLPPNRRFLNNLMRNRFVGCQIAINRSLITAINKFPSDDYCFYDHCLAQKALWNGRLSFLTEPQGIYRRHDGTLTTITRRRSLLKALASRIVLTFWLMFA